MALAREWLEPDTLQRLRELVIREDDHAVRAMRAFDEMRRLPHRSRGRRHMRNAFIRHAARALDKGVYT